MNERPRFSPRPLLIELGGEIDLRNAQALDDALCEAINRNRGELLVDLSTVPFIESCGMRMMLRVHQHATAQNCGVRWRGSSRRRHASLPLLDSITSFTSRTSYRLVCGSAWTFCASVRREPRFDKRDRQSGAVCREARVDGEWFITKQKMLRDMEWS